MKQAGRLCATFLVMFCLQAASASARGIEIETVQTQKVGDLYLLDAKISYEFSQDALEALEHGVALNLDVDIQAKRKRPWLWDKTVATKKLTYRLEHHPLSQNYILTDLNRYKRSNFRSLEGALSYLGSIKNQPLLEASKISDAGNYIGEIRARLDTKSLPSPLRPLAFISSQWRLSSPWVEWDIHP